MFFEKPRMDLSSVVSQNCHQKEQRKGKQCLPGEERGLDLWGDEMWKKWVWNVAAFSRMRRCMRKQNKTRGNV